MTSFHSIAADIAADIAAGRLRPGDRLPPQRSFAYARGIAPSTAGRVYAELVRRGLVSGEVGRGTFVRPPSPHRVPTLGEPPAARIDLETNYPVLPDQHRLLAPALSALASRPDALGAALHTSTVQGSIPARAVAAASLGAGGWIPKADNLLFAGNGRQAIAAAFSALVPPGGRIGFEAMTYPMAHRIAVRLGFVPVALAMDADGVLPDAIERAHQTAPLDAVYLQPALHNPLGTTMAAGRMTDLARLLTRLAGPVVIEDRVYAFLEETPRLPLAAFAPDQVVIIDSLSKRIAPGLTLGLVAAPDPLVTKLAKALVSGAWAAQGFALEMGIRWLNDGTVATLADAKRKDAQARQKMAARLLAGLRIRANPAAYHLLLDLPDHWRAETYVLAAARLGIAITPLAAFAVAPGHGPNTVRLALAAPTPEDLAKSLRALAELAQGEEPSLQSRRAD